NIPILATLLGWKYGFESPFKAEVYFVSTRTFTDQKWGTMNPVMLRDPEFGPVRVRAFGTYAMRVTDPGAFLRKVVGTDGRFTIEEINNQVRNMIVARFSDAIGEARIPVLDLASKYDEMGQLLTEKVRGTPPPPSAATPGTAGAAGTSGTGLAEYGIEVVNLLIENVSLPPEVEAALDKRSSMGVLGDMNRYTQYQTAEAIRDAAKNPGTAGSFIGIGLGGAMGGAIGGMAGGAMGQAQQAQQAAAAATPPAMPRPVQYFYAANGQPIGPVGAEVVRQQIAAGAVTRETLVWKEGMPAWAAAASIPDVAGMFGPPPMPGMPPMPPAMPQ
ncbi:MAG: SPFH domain-containing protein, partial [Phycisphaerales bacterium]|nr:SPFH domain-containing protein [Phycisphaerales bacterium]